MTLRKSLKGPLLALALSQLIAIPFVSTSFAAPEGIPPEGTLAFTVLRDGKPIGTHRLMFDSKGGDVTTVDIETKIAVKVLFVTAYRFEHSGHEVWTGDRIAALSSNTNDDGEKHDVSLKIEGGVLKGMADGKAASDDPSAPLGSLWSPAPAGTTVMTNTVTGKPMKVSVDAVGQEKVALPNGNSVEARHLAIHGDLERDVWYGPNNTLVKLAFKAKDGSAITYVRSQ